MTWIQIAKNRNKYHTQSDSRTIMSNNYTCPHVHYLSLTLYCLTLERRKVPITLVGFILRTQEVRMNAAKYVAWSAEDYCFITCRPSIIFSSQINPYMCLWLFLLWFFFFGFFGFSPRTPLSYVWKEIKFIQRFQK